MSDERVQSEGEWLASLSDAEKISFLVDLGRNLTVAGRSSYEVQGEGLDRPHQLRAVNEVQHRVLACLAQCIAGSVDGGFVRSMARWLLAPRQDKELEQLLAWAWSATKERQA